MFKNLISFLAQLLLASRLLIRHVCYPPRSKSLQSRLKFFKGLKPPFKQKVAIYWNEYQVPFIDAEDDQDAAFALGMVQAHLRLGQMELSKRIAYGRLSEILGPAAIEVDKALRTLGVSRNVKKSLDKMPADSRAWLDSFTKGINYYKEKLTHLPHETLMLDLKHEPWEAADTFAIERLGGADANWPALFNMLQLRKHHKWEEIWQDLQHSTPAMPVDYEVNKKEGYHLKAERFKINFLNKILMNMRKAGSNSFAVAPEKSSRDAAMIASDPHLGILIPNIWLITGLKCPAIHGVGMMAAGMPVFGFGRTRDIAWGGTNLRGWSSDMVDVSGLPEESIQIERHTIKTRFWKDTDYEVKLSPYGPIISDIPYLSLQVEQAIALRWIGHESSDEITAMFRAAKSKSIREFQESLKDFAVPALNFTAVDAMGNIGHFYASWFAQRDHDFPQDAYQMPDEHQKAWSNLLTSEDLRHNVNPPAGFIASANNRPLKAQPTPLGWLFSSKDRVTRISKRIQKIKSLELEDLISIQHDTYSRSSKKLKNLLIDISREITLSKEEKRVIQVLKLWDAKYEAQSQSALIFEAVLSKLADEVYGRLHRQDEVKLWMEMGQLKEKIIHLLETRRETIPDEVIHTAIKAGYKYVNSDKVWGSVHKTRLQHLLGHLPIFGKLYRIKDIPSGGSQETVMKSAHELTVKKHAAHYGAQARHISSMDSTNENYFVLLGGQDGWIDSENYIDQATLWFQGQYIQIPLEISEVEEEFKIKFIFNE